MNSVLLMTAKWFVACFCVVLFTTSARAQEPAKNALSQEEEIVALKEELTRLRGMLPAQAVAMTVVEYNYSNLWFAAHEQNWALAKFFLSETRARLRWALRLSPQRRISTGFVELQPFLDAFEQSPYVAMERALETQDIPAFETAYSNGLSMCGACHEASEKTYLRVAIPSVPAGSLINFSVD